MRRLLVSWPTACKVVRVGKMFDEQGGTDEIRSALDAATAHLRRGDARAASEAIDAAREKAVSEGRAEDAASLASIWSSFLVIQKDNAGALAAAEDAERRSGGEARFVVGSVLGLLSAGRLEEATEKAEMLLARSGADAGERHLAIAALGACALQAGDAGRAARRLTEALNASIQARVQPVRWDLSLVQKLIDSETAGDVCARYLMELRAAALEAGDQPTARRASKLLERLSPGYDT